MKIGLDGRTIFRMGRRGIGKSLVDLYRRMAERNPSISYVVFYQIPADNPFEALPNVECRCIDIAGDRLDLWQHVRLPLSAKTASVDVLHCPANTAPWWPIVPMVVTIHDLIPLEPEFKTQESLLWGKIVARAARKALRIITPSEYTRQQILQAFGVSGDKVIVNHWAPDSGCRKVTDTTELNRIRVRYGLRIDQPYVLAFGTADPRKNTARLIQSWSKLPESIKKEYALLLVGVQEQAREEFNNLVRNLGLEASCIVNGFADEQDISALISGSTVLCYPSLSEGFGLPILDAFKCEIPVLTSNTTSLPEVAGDAAMLVNPRDTDSIARGLEELLENDILRSELIYRGRARVEQFTWEACADRLARVFEDVCGIGN